MIGGVDHVVHDPSAVFTSIDGPWVDERISKLTTEAVYHKVDSLSGILGGQRLPIVATPPLLDGLGTTTLPNPGERPTEPRVGQKVEEFDLVSRLISRQCLKRGPATLEGSLVQEAKGGLFFFDDSGTKEFG